MLISRCISSTNDHRDSLKFVQEVARFVTSWLFGRNVARGVWKDKVATHLSLCLTAAAHAFSNLHTYRNILIMANQREGPPFTLSDLDHDMGLMCVCYWTTGRLSESQRLFFFLRNEPVQPQIFFDRTIEKLGHTCDQIGRTLEPCNIIGLEYCHSDNACLPLDQSVGNCYLWLLHAKFGFGALSNAIRSIGSVSVLAR